MQGERGSCNKHASPSLEITLFFTYATPEKSAEKADAEETAAVKAALGRNGCVFSRYAVD